MPGPSARGYLPPLSCLRLHLKTGTLLIMRQHDVPRDLMAFQFNRRHKAAQGPAGYALRHLQASDRDCVAGIRSFCATAHFSSATRLSDQKLLDWLKHAVDGGHLAGLWIKDEAHTAPANVVPVTAAAGSAPLAAAASLVGPAAASPVAGFTAGMTATQKIVLMFKTVPQFLPNAAKAQFLAFLTKENLEIIAGFFALTLAAQAVPGADAVVDAILLAVAWAMAGWTGLVAAADLLKAVIAASEASNQGEIDAAARQAALALITLGVTAFMVRLLAKAKPGGAGRETAAPADDAPPPARGSTNDIMKRYASRDEGLSYPRVDDQFRPESNYDPENPTADQKMAINQLNSQTSAGGGPAWNADKIDQILNSGSNFKEQPFAPGDPLYKIGNANLNPATDSPYLLDQAGMDNLVNKGYVDQNMQVVDPIGVKQELALPCYNGAQSVFQGQVTAPTTGVVSQINPATELFNLSDGAGGTTSGQILMNGGGTQVALPPSAVSFPQ